MRSTRRCILSTISLLMALLLAGCSQSNTTVIQAMPTPARTAQPRRVTVEESQVEAGDAPVITLGVVISDEAVVSPYETGEADLYSLNHLAYESVVELDDSQKPAPLLADRWEKNGYTWTFYLRSGVAFHNGVALTADDVVASYQRILEAGEGNPYYENILSVSSMTVLDSNTLSVTMKSLSYLNIYSMTFPVAQRATLYDYYPMGTGAYWFVSPQEGEFLRMERNPLWWKRQPYIGVVRVKRYSESDKLMTAFELGEIDALATKISTASLSRKLSDRSTLDFSTLQYECLVPNMSSGFLSDPMIRQAIMYGIDRNTLAASIYQDMVALSEVPVLPGTWLNESQSTTYYYSPERALQILYSQGWGDTNGDGMLDRIQDGLIQELAVTLLVYEEPTRSSRFDAARLIADQLAKIGINVTVDLRTKANVRTALRNDSFDLALVAYNMNEKPSLDFMFRSTSASNYSNYSSETMNKLLDNVSAAEEDDSLRLAMSRVQQQIVEDLPILGLFFRSGVLISRRGIGGLTGIRATQTFRGFEFWQPVD